MNIKITKKDFLLAVLAGELAAWLSFPVLKNLKVFNMLAERGIDAIGFSVFWILFVPAGAIAGLGFFYFLAKYKDRVGFFELGKYGIIGVLNTMLNAGAYNLLIFITNIASGITLDIFFIAAFIVTVVNSFFWNKFWSFAEKNIENIKKEAIQFFGISAAVALINAVILHIIVNIIGAPSGVEPKIWANVALGFTIITAFLGNFFSYKYIVFSDKK
ncbi:MAG: GtrA family protein, partial [Patescibacteria group bacterium]